MSNRWTSDVTKHFIHSCYKIQSQVESYCAAEVKQFQLWILVNLIEKYQIIFTSRRELQEEKLIYSSGHGQFCLYHFLWYDWPGQN